MLSRLKQIMAISSLLMSLSPAVRSGDMNDHCEGKLSNKNSSQRPTLISEDIQLVPVSRDHESFLRELFSVPDIHRFYLYGFDPDLTAESNITRSLNPKGAQKNTFEAYWVIQHEGVNAGIIYLAKTRLKSLHPEIAAYFPKEHPDDLYLVTGYALHPNFRGRGLITRALQMVIEFAQNVLEAKYIFANSDARNISSLNVLFRAGFRIIPTSDVQRMRFVKQLR